MSDNKNHTTDLNKREKIYQSIDKLILILPDYDTFFLNYQMKFIELTNEEKKKFPNIGNEIRIELLDLGYVKNPPKVNTIFSLTEKGRLVKSKGGHFKYLESIKPKRDWGKIIPIVAIIVTVIFGVLNYNLNKDKNRSVIEKAQLNKQIDSLKEKIKILENKRGQN